MKYSAIVEPVVKFVDAVVPPILLILGILGILYIMYLGVRLIFSSWWTKGLVMEHIVRVVTAYFIVTTMIYLLGAYTPSLLKVADGEKVSLSDTKVDLSKPFNDAKDLIKSSRKSVKDKTVSKDIANAVGKINNSSKTFVHEELDAIPKTIGEIGENLPNYGKPAEE